MDHQRKILTTNEDAAKRLQRRDNNDVPHPIHDCVIQETYFRFYQRMLIPKLYRLASEGCWEEVIQRVRSHPREAKFVNAYPPNDTAMHRVLRVNLDGCFKNEVEDRNREELLDTARDLRSQVFLSLVKANPDIVMVLDVRNQTPLHLACQNCCPNETSITHHLFIMYPEATAIQDIHGNTPLHLLVVHPDTPVSLITLLIRYTSPSTLNARDCNGKRPIDIALNPTVQEILRIQEQQWGTQNSNKII